MPEQDCGQCELLRCGQRLSDKDTLNLVARLLCEVADNTAGGGGGGGGGGTPYELLTDSNGVTFIRIYTTPVPTDIGLDGAPFVPVGAVTPHCCPKDAPTTDIGSFDFSDVTNDFVTVINPATTVVMRILIISSTLDEDVYISLDDFVGIIIRAGSSMTIDYGSSGMERRTGVYISTAVPGVFPTMGNLSATIIGPLV